MIPIVVDNRARIPVASLPEAALKDLVAAFTHDNPQHAAKRAMGVPVWTEPKQYETYTTDTEEIAFPRGGMQRVREVLTRHGLAWEVIDARCAGEAVRAAERLEHRVRLRDYQREMVAAALKVQNCILRAPTGSGKTTVGFAFAAATGLSTLVLVPTAALMRQWVTRAVSELGLEESEVGVIRGDRCKLRPLTVAMQKTIAERGVSEEVNAYFGAVIADEVQFFAAKTFFEAIDPFRAKYRVGISADERRKDRKEFLTRDLFGEVAHEVHKRDLVAAGAIADVAVRVIPTEFRADWYGVPDADDGAPERVEKRLDTASLNKAMAADPERNALVLLALGHEPGAQALVFAHLREHCQVLDALVSSTGVRTGNMMGGDDANFAASVAGLKSGAVAVGVGTYKAMGTGVDLPSIGIGVAAGPIAAGKQFFGQVCGRLARPKARAVLYYLWDRHVFGLKHLRNVAAWNRDVTVLDGGRWVPAKAYIAKLRADG